MIQPDKTLIANSLSNGQKTLSEYESKKILSEYGIPTTREMLADNLDLALQSAEKLGYPVVLKVCSPDLTHKTELGLIKVGLKNPQALEKAFKHLQPYTTENGGTILVQEMISGKRELVLGLTRNADFGICVMIGLGGIFTEAFADVAFATTPLTVHDVKQMKSNLKSKQIFDEFRGMPAIDQNVLTHSLNALGRIAQDHPEIKEIDINPMIVHNGQPIAVDALVVLEKPDVREKKIYKSNKTGLDKFFSPKNIAIIGASANPGKSGNDVIQNILDNDYQGKIYLVNPKGGEILGHSVYKSIAELPDNIDQAIIILPAEANPKTIRDCASKGIKSLVLAAGGFAEVDQKGKKLQEEITQIIHETGVRTIGPNTSGHISTPASFTSSFFPLGKLPKGNISYIAQTGNFATHTMRYIMSGENYGIARVLGLGNKLDVEESEVLEYYAKDIETKAIFLYLESFKFPRRFLKIANKVSRKKPVIILKGGATPEGAGAAVAHTAALASDDRIVDAVLRQAGVVRIHNYSHLFLAAKALAWMPMPMGNRVSFLAPSGAMLVCLTDLCRQQLNLQVPQLKEENRKKLQAFSPKYIKMRNPIDIWPAAAIKGVEFAYGEAIEIALQDPNIDAVVAVLMLTDETGIPSYEFIVKLAKKYPQKPLYITFSAERKHMEQAKAYLEPRGVPTFPLIEQPFEVLDILYKCRLALERP